MHLLKPWSGKSSAAAKRLPDAMQRFTATVLPIGCPIGELTRVSVQVRAEMVAPACISFTSISSSATKRSASNCSAGSTNRDVGSSTSYD